MAYPRADAQQLAGWLDAGLAAHRQGDLERALQAYRQILSVSADHPAALNLLGTALLQRGETAEAIAYLERASRRKRDDPHVLANLAHAYVVEKRYGEACAAYKKASRIAPGEVQIHVGLGTALALDGKLDQAEAVFKRLTMRFPDAPLVWFNFGHVLRDREQPAAALDAYRRALALDPHMIDARNSVGRVLHSMLQFVEAEREYRACIEAAPDYLIARYNLASVTMDLGRFGDAEAECREIVKRAPESPDAHRLLGTALGHQARLLEALACYARAAAIAPDDPQTAQTYGAALMEAGHSGSGVRWLAHAAFLNPESVSRRQVTSGALLAHGCLQDGWRDYAYRPAAVELLEKYRAVRPRRDLPDDIAGKHVCVLAEQGLGDQLFFLRYAPLVAARGARVSARPARKIESLLRRMPVFDQVLAEDQDLPQADVYVLAGDLPLALAPLACSVRPDAGAVSDAAVATFPRHISIFAPPPAPTLRVAPLPERLDEMRERIARSGPPPYIAVTWRGGTPPEKQQTAAWLLYKSIGLPALATALAGLNGTVIAVQRKPAAGEIDALAAALGHPVHDYTALNDDLEGMLALLSLVDEYIGVSNTNMHLRAAAGNTARVLVPVPAEWRWMQSGRSSPWFPGFSIYRQSLQGDWSAALERLARDLQERYSLSAGAGGA